MKVFSFSKTSPLLEQVLPIGLAVLVFGFLAISTFLTIRLVNSFAFVTPVVLQIHWRDVFVGAFIYFKTSVDFAILIGYLMKANPGWKNRIAIEVGTALGNGAGVILILCFWMLFKEFRPLLALMIILSALVLFEMAESGLKHFDSWRFKLGVKRKLYNSLKIILENVLHFTRPVASKILPNFSKTLNGDRGLKWTALLVFSLTTPFVLGLDDFAGYVPLFSLVNVFGFALGVMGAHTLLNIGLFANPERTIKWFKNQWVSFFGAAAFTGLAIWAVVEAVRILL